VLDEVRGRSLAGMVIRGRGRHFSAGADLSSMKAVWGDSAAVARHQDLFRCVEDLPFPVIAWVSGACLGSGLELALCARLLLAAPSAVFGCPEATFGLMPGCGGTWRLARRLGISRTLDLVMTGRLVAAEEARRLGVVDGILPRDQGFEMAEALVRRVATRGGPGR